MKISLTWLLFHRWGTKADSSGWGRTTVAAWVASVREGLERRTRDCLNMESKWDRARDSVPVIFLSAKGPIKTHVGLRISYRKMCIYAKTEARSMKKIPVAFLESLHGQSNSSRKMP